jgi:hypothetical protein
MVYGKPEEHASIPLAVRQIIADRPQQIGADQLGGDRGGAEFEPLGQPGAQLMIAVDRVIPVPLRPGLVIVVQARLPAIAERLTDQQP